MATSFETDIKNPYFSKLDRDAMIDANHTGGFTLDLWSLNDVRDNWQDIYDAVVVDKVMPPSGPGSDGPWDPGKIQAFGRAFTSWKTDGFQP